jgi:hypothetical protein
MKFRVIVNGVSFYTTKKALTSGMVGDDTNVNCAVSIAYNDMVSGNYGGIAVTTRHYDSKMIQHNYQVQISKL